MNCGRYQLLEEVGRGSMGVVYKAHDPQIDRRVALKILRRDNTADESFVQRFVKEARTIGRLSHPNIVTVYDSGQDHGDPYIAMEFIEGVPLSELIRESGLELERVIEIGIQAAEALDYAHSKGVIHRDIKPSNIIVQPHGQIKITDFGIARLEGSSDLLLTQAGEIIGTPAYMSPEQARGGSVDQSTDIFSLGIVLYELAVGRRPFKGDGKSILSVIDEIVRQEPQEPAGVSDLIPQELSMIIMKCLRKARAERFRAGKELAEALKGARRPKGESVIQPEPMVVKRRRNHGALSVVTVSLAILVAGVVYFAQQRGNPSQRPSIKEDCGPLSRKESPAAASEAKQTVSALPVTPTDSKTPKPESKGNNHLKARGAPATSAVKPPRETESRKQHPSLTNKENPAPNLTPLTVKTNPPGAHVYVDENFKGITPLTLVLARGKHHVRVARPGYEDGNKQIMLEETMEYPLTFTLRAVNRPEESLPRVSVDQPNR